MKYAYYPGCAAHSASAKEYGSSAKAVCQALGIQLVEIPDWNCCGAIDAVSSLEPDYSVALAARNLALAEKMQTDIVTVCSACYFTLARTNKILKENSEVRSKVTEALNAVGLSYSGNVKVRHLLEVVLSDVGLEKIKAQVKNPLKALNVASYYGCLLVRPVDLTNFDNPEHPSKMDELAEALGASKVDYYSKTKCCGASMAVTDEKVMLELSKKILLDAKNAGANVMVTACPLCQFNLDAKQADIEAAYSMSIGLPILYFTQLIGLALGIDNKELGLERNIVSPMAILPQAKEIVSK
jgi:heterodisulfide reductase subunit B